MLDADGAELQPADGRSVRVSFRAAEVADPNYDVAVRNGDFTITAKEKGSYEAASGSGSTGALTFTFESAADDGTTLDLFKGVEADGKAVPEKDSSGKATRNGQTQGKGDTSKAAATETIEDEDAPLAAGINCMLVAGLSAAALLALCAVAVYVVRRRRA